MTGHFVIINRSAEPASSGSNGRGERVEIPRVPAFVGNSNRELAVRENVNLGGARGGEGAGFGQTQTDGPDLAQIVGPVAQSRRERKGATSGKQRITPAPVGPGWPKEEPSVQI